METYPIIKIPNKLNNILNLLPPLLEMPKKPEYPQEVESPPYPQKDLPNEPEYNKVDYGWGWIFIAIGIIFFIIIGNSEKSSGALGIIGFFLFLVGVIAVYCGATQNPKIKEKYDKAKREYPNILRQYESDFQKEIESYEHNVKKSEELFRTRLKNYKEIEVPLYLKELEVYNTQANSIRSKENIQLFREEKLNEFLSVIKKPGVHPTNKEIKRGVSEIDFYNLLIAEFKEKVHQNLTISFKNSSKCYLPDFTYYNHNNGLCIDIEIDEPYVGSNGTPIHYIGSNDDNRDSFFLENGWIVIRFAEEQIVKESSKCLRIIQEIINKVILLDSDLTRTKITPIKRWTKEESHQMAFKRVRNKYLEITLSERLEIEEHETSELVHPTLVKQTFDKPKLNSVNQFSNKSIEVNSRYDNDFVGEPDDLPF